MLGRFSKNREFFINLVSYRHPGAEDVYLIIEIADSTLKTDLTLKKQVYAEAKIPDYWV